MIKVIKLGLHVLISLVLFIPFVLAQEYPEVNSSPLSAEELGKYRYCGADKDCIIVTNGCCDCANGGQDVAINRRRYDDFQKRFACNHVICTLKDANPLCRTGLVVCLNHKCRHIAPFEFELLGGILSREHR